MDRSELRTGAAVEAATGVVLFLVGALGAGAIYRSQRRCVALARQEPRVAHECWQLFVVELLAFCVLTAVVGAGLLVRMLRE